MPEDTEHQNCGECGRPLKDSRDFKSLRAEADTVIAERDALKTQLLNRTIRDAGFDPEVGVVKRLAKEYEGDLDAEQFKTFAVAEGLTPKEAETTTQEPTETEQQLAHLQGPGDRLREMSTQQTPATDLDSQIVEAESSGNFALARSLKNQKAKALMRAS